MKAWIQKALEVWFLTWPLLVVLPLFVLLLLRNPFSDRTLIPNFEPFPDSFYYVVPPTCWLRAEGWHMCRPTFEGIAPSVPPLYSITLLTSFVFTPDIRAFYFTNVGLALLTLFLLFNLIRKVSQNNWATFLIMLLYVTQYHTTWFPTLAMAENLIVPLTLLAIDRMLAKPSFFTTFSLLILGSAFYATKFAYAPLLALLFLTAGWKTYRLIAMGTISKKRKKILIGVLALSGAIVLLSQQGRLLSIVSSRFFVLDEATASSFSNLYFSLFYVQSHLPAYLKALIGEPIRVLWHTASLLPQWSQVLALVGIGSSLCIKRFRSYASVWIALVIPQLVFMSTFYTLDARYIIHVIPLQLLGLALFLKLTQEALAKFAPQFWPQLLFSAVCFTLAANVFFYRFGALRHQIGVNLKYAEQPWWYLATNEMNHFFDSYSQQEQSITQPPYLVTLINPYMYDAFGNDAYQVLPLSEYQDMKTNRDHIWGIPLRGERSLIEHTRFLLQQQETVFITNYGINASGTFTQEFNLFLETFKTTEMSQSCYGLCNIYKLELKETQSQTSSAMREALSLQ